MKINELRALLHSIIKCINQNSLCEFCRLPLVCSKFSHKLLARVSFVFASMVLTCGCGGGTSGTGVSGESNFVRSGSVVDSFGAPVAGAVISSASENISVVADESGHFELPSELPAEDLVVEYNGRQTEAEMKFPGSASSSDESRPTGPNESNTGVQVGNDSNEESNHSVTIVVDPNDSISSNVEDPNQDVSDVDPVEDVPVDHRQCRSNAECNSGEFCDLSNNPCGVTAKPGICTELAEMCPEYYGPVCGCDGITYSNKCFANGAGVSLRGTGECR